MKKLRGGSEMGQCDTFSQQITRPILGQNSRHIDLLIIV
jgi:hypothetical protein